MNDPHYGEILMSNSTFKSMSGTPGRVKWACRPIGADNEFIYGKYLGLGERHLKALKENGVV
jgi:crotonobetainyl-CoA:carnitine CoA-transferase CaiB-like acyl-CoA transferase